MKKMLKAYDLVASILNSNENIYNCSCKVNKEYELPCCHMLFQRYRADLFPLVREEDIPDIYYIYPFENCEKAEIQTVQVVNKKNENYKYSNLMDMVSPIAAEANRNPDIQRLFDKLFNGFNDLKKSSNGSPEYIPQSGRPIIKQSLLVDHRKCGSQKIKRRYKCSNCGEIGHNIAKCPLRSNNNK